MNDEQFKKANEIKEKISDIENELKIWTAELTSTKKLGYLQGWNNNHATKLETSISEGIFDNFRMSSMDNLKLKLVYLEKQFEEL